jgi:hypothetical protein
LGLHEGAAIDLEFTYKGKTSYQTKSGISFYYGCGKSEQGECTVNPHLGWTISHEARPQS